MLNLMVELWAKDIWFTISNDSATGSTTEVQVIIAEIKYLFNNVSFSEPQSENEKKHRAKMYIEGSIFAAQDIEKLIKLNSKLSSKIEFGDDYIFSGRVAKTRDDKLLLDSWLKVYQRNIQGRDYDILDNYSAVTALIINEYQEVLLVKQYRPAIMTITCELPAGCLDNQNETPAAAMVRELREETNLDIDQFLLQRLLSYYSALGHSASENTIYYAKILKKQLKQNDVVDEDVLSAFWMPLAEFEQHIRQGNIRDSKTIISYYHYKTFIDSGTCKKTC